MQRSFSSPAIILSLKPSGENNTSVTIITPEKGIMYVTLYGGPKSRLKSLVTRFNSGIIYIYENPEKNQIKISDFDVKSYHNSFSENLFKYYAASLASELAVKTSCAGSFEQCWNLISAFFDGMELCNEDQSRLGLIRFLWRYLELLGVQPDTSRCGSCGSDFSGSRFAPGQISHYNITDNTFICEECFSSGEYSIPLKIQALRYLTGISTLSPGQARKNTVDKEAYFQMRELVFFLIQNHLDIKLNSIETGAGIL